MTRLHVPVQVRWSDLDAYGHVNNVAFLTLLEEARIAAFWRGEAVASGSGEQITTALLDARPGGGTATIVARQEVEYLAPIGYQRRPVDVVLWIGKLGGASIEISYEVVATDDEGETFVAAKAATTLVLVDTATGTPRRIADEERAAWASYVEEPVRFRHTR